MASAATVGVRTDLRDVHLEDWIQPRTWLGLYGQWLGKSRHIEVKLAPVQELPDEVIIKVFEKLSATTVSRCGMVCKQWRRHAESPQLWQRLCTAAFVHTSVEKNVSLMRTAYGQSWKRMYIERPHIRFDGIYVSRNTYIRVGAVHWDIKNPVHLVVYYRYYRFFPDGTVLTRTSPQPVSNVWRSLHHMPYSLEKGDSRLPGRWTIKGSTVFVACLYPGVDDSEVRSKLTLRSKQPGLNNRMDVLEIFTYDRNDGSKVSLEDPSEEEDNQCKTTSRRGLNTLVLVPWSEVHSHVINLPSNKMDIYIPG